jgi:hypothetical protein
MRKDVCLISDIADDGVYCGLHLEVVLIPIYMGQWLGEYRYPTVKVKLPLSDPFRSLKSKSINQHIMSDNVAHALAGKANCIVVS